MGKFIIVVFSFLLFSCSVQESCESTKGQIKYPELKGFEFYGKGEWSKIVPGKTSANSVIDLMGKGEESEHVNSLLIYKGYQDYKIYIYLTKPVNNENSIVESVDFIPNGKVPMGQIKWLANFKIVPVRAACAAWKEYTDKSGLVYEVYTTSTRYGGHVPGDLNRVSYRESAKVTK
ncbi:MAG: hypothetical protein NE328_16625 [Lentisphaeraceae bacterium]|nr:hypothetical protein [Lentisphaeraceae bacterium]